MVPTHGGVHAVKVTRLADEGKRRVDDASAHVDESNARPRISSWTEHLEVVKRANGSLRLRPVVVPAGLLLVASWTLAAPGDIGTPAAITREPRRGSDSGWVMLGPSVDICNLMGMLTNQTYDAGNGNAISGMAAFGEIRDLQLVDDCFLGSAYDIDRVCAGFLTQSGTLPQTGLWVQVYPDAGGVPAANASDDLLILPANLTGTPFTDTVFGLQGLVLCGHLQPSSLVLPAGVWWFDIQPVDTSANGDWFYHARDQAFLNGGDAHGRDGAAAHGTAFGGPYPGGYGTSTWTSMQALGFGAGDAAFSVSATLPVELPSFTIE